MRLFPTLTRILLVLLSLCLVLSAFAACAAEEDETLETEATESDGSDDSLDDSFDEDLYDENGYLKDQIPDEDLNYENKELKYSIKKYIEYNGEEQQVNVYWDIEEFLQAGTYKVQIFADGNMIGSGSFNIKK